MLALNRKSKKLLALGMKIAKKAITKLKRKAKKLEDAIKLNPKKEKEIRAKIDEIKAKIALLEKITSGFSTLDAELNKEIGWLSNESGALKDMSTVNKATAAEKECLAKEKEILATLLSLVMILKGKKKAVQKPQQASATAAAAVKK